VGDVIAAINGHSVKGTDDLIAILRTMRAGQTVTLTLLRKGEQIDVSAQLAQRPDQP
jgi:S1-C subfamily serine protease